MTPKPRSLGGTLIVLDERQMEDSGDDTICDRFHYRLWKAHEDEDQLNKDAKRQSEESSDSLSGGLESAGRSSDTEQVGGDMRLNFT